MSDSSHGLPVQSRARAYQDGVAYVAGKYVPIAQAAIPITDWGFLRSDATYDVVTVWNGAFFRIDAHLERFMHSCQRWRLNPGLSPAQITRILARCVRLSGLRSSYVEMICTRGQPPWGSRDPRQAVNQFYAFAVPFVWLANEQQRANGLRIRISDVQRISPRSVDPRAKNYHWNDLTMGLLGALDAGADSVLLVDAAGNVVEESATRRADELTRRAAALDHLLGLLREKRSALARRLRAPLQKHLDHYLGILFPGARIEVADDLSPGAITRRLIETYWAWHADPAYSLPIDYSV